MNRGVPHSLIDDIKRIGNEFFQLPAKEKGKYVVRYYEGYMQIFVVFEEQKLDWGDLLGLIISPLPSRNLSVWPYVPSDFKYAQYYIIYYKYILIRNQWI